jgi:hypothetical protein
VSQAIEEKNGATKVRRRMMTRHINGKFNGKSAAAWTLGDAAPLDRS